MPVFPCNFYSDSSVLRKIIMSENFSQGQLSRIHIDLRLSQRRPVPESHQISVPEPAVSSPLCPQPANVTVNPQRAMNSIEMIFFRLIEILTATLKL